MSVTKSTPPPDLDVSVILPVFNERGHLDDEINRIRSSMSSSGYSFEIIVVDDGSTDGSGERLRELEDIRLIQFQSNRGSGSARKYGTLQARGRVVVWTDVDMTYPNDEIPRLVKELDGGWDQVVGARTSEQGTVRLLRTPAKWFIRKLASYLVDAKIPDLNSGLRAFRRSVAYQYLYLLPRGFSCVTTLTLAFLNNGYSVKYIPIDYYPRAGESKFHWWKDTRRYLLQVVRMMLMYNPLRVFMPPAVLLLLAGSGKVVYDIFDKNWRLGTNTLAILGLGLTFAIVGMIADLMVSLNKRQDYEMPAMVAVQSATDRVAG
ncbi:MAG: glycosyltransferase family 2 protein [Acidimicrobiia bacterium]|nr:glycosyltransferase family 2 protein [Acidimicrobiia bacterium]NNC41120.1 glycosyltransferase family 2 protein [Acidimicrobiia bacterium]